MAASCVWKCCDQEREQAACNSAVVVQFSNGNLKNTDHVDFSLYRNIDVNAPRKKSRRIVVAETDRLSYVANNFGPESLKCNTLCKYYVGVLDKNTKRMEVHSAQLFNMHPIIPGESIPEDKTEKSTATSYREKVDSLIEAFGTNKQKRALNSRRLNLVGSEALHHAVAKAADGIIKQRGVEALEQDVAQSQAQNDIMHHLPPCHVDASRPEDVYPFDELLSPVEYAALEEAGSKFAELSAEELQKMEQEGSPMTVLLLLQTLPRDTEARERQARCAWYLNQLVRLSHQKMNINRKAFGEGCPRVVHNKIMRTFTIEVFNSGRLQSVVPTSMRVKLAAHCLALLLHVGQWTAELTLLQRDLGLTDTKMVEVAKSMGLRLSKRYPGAGDMAGLEEEHRLATLELPLVKYDQPKRQHKRKKMT
ncbi:DNA-directed RNA polymerase I subunit RPA49 [Paramormyrops kingsleyae]|uniref:RNA polymerase I subunit E n=1 Tax=Paramormyrops kingsleyae TaxID=1676925 RepID=A0A3B3RGQ0_9TELE|nr:DNA-directed RNA polymerase I subunit RPA49 [Paramormyrops kingsleyae]